MELPIEAIEAIVERALEKQLSQHEIREREMWERAFPRGNLEAHREYHQAKIDASKAEQEFYQSLKMKLAEAGALGALKLVLWLMMVGIGAVLAGKLGFLPTFLGLPK